MNSYSGCMHQAPQSTESPASTAVSRTIKASRAVIYRAFIDEKSIVSWLPPDSMRGLAHVFEPWAGGRFHMSLIYNGTEGHPAGKTQEDTDTFEGIFAELIPDKKIVWTVIFKSDDPAFAGKMVITTTLEDASDGTRVTMLCENIPKGIDLRDNEEGGAMSLRKLAALVE